jgi:integral membrane protein
MNGLDSFDASGEQTAERAAADDERRRLLGLEIAALLEATTLVALVCIAVPLKHFLGVVTAVKVMGPVHGLAFIFYIWAVIQTVNAGDWEGRDIVRMIGVAFVPFAGFLNLSWLRRQQKRLGAP